MIKKKMPVHIAENCELLILTAEATVVVPCSITAVKNENKIISSGSKCPNQAINTPVKPCPPTILSLNDW